MKNHDMPNRKTIIISSVILSVSLVLFVWVGFQMFQLNKLDTLASEAELTMEIKQQLMEKEEQEKQQEQQEPPTEPITLETSAPEATSEQPAPTEETITFR